MNLGILYCFKYLDYTITVFNFITKQNIQVFNIALPIGISFFTFQAMSYVIDVYRLDVTAEKNILNVGLYISFFPQLVAGPIVRYYSIAEQIKKQRTMTMDQFGEGMKRFICGFCKKILLANNLAFIADSAFQCGDFHTMSVALAWIGSLSFSLQILFDFSGYSDMAIGLGKMFGFQFEENFNYPYISRTVTEFWRRWHISLGKWFRDYVYIPLGGSRVKPIRHIFNLFVVWTLTGLWHGANVTFAAWGFMYFVLLVFEKYILKPEQRNQIFRIAWQIAILFLINFGWVLFKIESAHDFVQFIRIMFGWYGNALFDAAAFRMLRQYGLFIPAGIIFSMPVAPKLGELLSRNRSGELITTFVVPIIYFVGFLWAVSFLILGAHNPFIYFNF